MKRSRFLFLTGAVAVLSCMSSIALASPSWSSSGDEANKTATRGSDSDDRITAPPVDEATVQRYEHAVTQFKRLVTADTPILTYERLTFYHRHIAGIIKAARECGYNPAGVFAQMNITIDTFHQQSVFTYAVVRGDFALACALLWNNVADPTSELDAATQQTFLHMANDCCVEQQGFKSVLDSITTNHSDIFNLVDINTNTPLHEYARRGQLQLLDYALTHGADANAINRHGKTPLMALLSDRALSGSFDDNDTAIAIRIIGSPNFDLALNRAAFEESDRPEIIRALGRKVKDAGDKIKITDFISKEREAAIIGLLKAAFGGTDDIGGFDEAQFKQHLLQNGFDFSTRQSGFGIKSKIAAGVVTVAILGTPFYIKKSRKGIINWFKKLFGKGEKEIIKPEIDAETEKLVSDFLELEH